MKEKPSDYARALLALCNKKKKSEIDAMINSFVQYFGSRGKLKFLHALMGEVEKEEEAQSGVHRVDCRVAHTDEKHVHALASLLSDALDGDVRLAVTEDSSLLCGGIFTIGDMRYDGSLKGRLQALEKSLGTFSQ